MEETCPDPLPREPGARLGIAILALPSFLVFRTCFIAIPIASGPPNSIASWLMMLLMAEFLGLAALVTFLALVWAACTPQWIADLLQSQARRLVFVMGAFLLIGGVMTMVATIAAGLPVPSIIMAFGVVIGAILLFWSPFKEA